jgi:hypothetical protein
VKVTINDYNHDIVMIIIIVYLGKCGIRLSAVKGHPECYELNSMNRLEIKDIKIQVKQICLKGMIRYFQRVVYIARDPYYAAFAAHQFRTSGMISTLDFYHRSSVVRYEM